MSSDIKIYKLNYSGTVEEIPQENLLNQFNLFDILTFYVFNQKHMYIWIGKRASQTLKGHIPKIREIFSKDYPELNILRYITVESGTEPLNLLEILNLPQKELNNHLKNLEMKLLPFLSEINRLKGAADKKFMAEDYNAAIDLAEKILRISNDINDESLEVDQRNFIDEARIRNKAHGILQEIESETAQVVKTFQKLRDDKKFKEAHDLVIDLKQKYEKDYNIYSIPMFQELILKDENLLYDLRVEQKKLNSRLDDLEIKFNRLIKDYYLKKANSVLVEAKGIINDLIEERASKRWDYLEYTLNDARRSLINQIHKSSKEAIKFLEKREVKKALDYFEKIIEKLGKNI